MEMGFNILALVKVSLRHYCTMRDLYLFRRPYHVGVLLGFLNLLCSLFLSFMWVISGNQRLRSETMHITHNTALGKQFLCLGSRS